MGWLTSAAYELEGNKRNGPSAAGARIERRRRDDALLVDPW